MQSGSTEQNKLKSEYFQTRISHLNKSSVAIIQSEIEKLQKDQNILSNPRVLQVIQKEYDKLVRSPLQNHHIRNSP